MSKLLTEGLFNTRDLGGMTALDGRVIKPGLLLRSGMLNPATENDIKLLESMNISTIIDFRASEEISGKPDPIISGANYYYLSVDADQEVGLRRDDEAEEKLIDVIIDRAINEPLFAVHYMTETYKRIVKSSWSRENYSKFIDLVLESKGTALWHCTAGKDRAGFASVIIEKILGVSDEDIMKDYLFTNECLAQETERLVAMLAEKLAGKAPEMAVRQLFAADRLYLEAAYSAIEEEYGDWETYLKYGLNTDEYKIQQFIDKYTEQK